MILGILSDTHDRLEEFQLAYNIFVNNKVELIIHCGDWNAPYSLMYFNQINTHKLPVMGIFGNNEGERTRIPVISKSLATPIDISGDGPREETIDGRKIAICHGHDKKQLHALIDSHKYDAIFTGHTHRSRNEKIGKTLVLNPGTLSHSYVDGETHIVRIVDFCSVGVYDTKTNTAEIIKLS